jgi:hypothetical protein
MSGLQFTASLFSSLAWPVAAVLAVALLRTELVGVLHRMQSVEFPGGKATFDTLSGYERMIATAARDVTPAADDATARQEAAEFSVVEALVGPAPGQAVIDAWGLLEYELAVASDRIAPDKPHGWPQVARNLESWDKWPLLYPAVQELRNLRDYTVGSKHPPTSADAARYVSVAEDLVTTLRNSFPSQPGDDQ